MEAIGLGEADPITEARRGRKAAKNRRVELEYLRTEAQEKTE